MLALHTFLGEKRRSNKEANDDCSPAVDPPYPVYGGLFREEAIMLLRRFYVQENEKGESLAIPLITILRLERKDLPLKVYPQLQNQSPRRIASSRRRSYPLAFRPRFSITLNPMRNCARPLLQAHQQSLVPRQAQPCLG